MSRSRAAAALCLLLAAPAEARQAEIPGPAPELTGVRIGEVFVERLNVFDPGIKGEDWWMFRTANKLHVLTREHVIRRELLIGQGDPWDPLRVLESERNLRSNGSFRRAEIVPVRVSSDTVNVMVHTQDAWTTNLNLAAGTEGGESYFGFGFEENNLAGYGKSVQANFRKDGKRTEKSVGYGDPRFLGSRLALGTSYAKSSEGDNWSVSLRKPFYALESIRGQSVSFSRSQGDATIFRDGEEYSKFRVNRRRAEASAGARLNADRFFVQRVEAGWHSDQLQYGTLPQTRAGTLPVDRELSGPIVGYAWIQPRYVKETYLDAMERVEDFNVGNELATRFGWMGRSVGSDRDRLLYRASEQQGLSFGPGRLLLARVTAGGRVANGKAENGLLSAGLIGFWRSRWQTLVAHLEAAKGRSLDPDSAVILGGNSGLRGYKNNSFVGGQAVLLNLEDRFFWDREWFHLIRLGGAVFLDSGAVAGERDKLAFSSLKSDAGFGLRVAPTRSRGGGVARVDLAYALNRGPGGSRWVLSIAAGQAFNLFNSASRGIEPAPASRLY